MDLPQADYDMRTALMVAAADGSLAAVRGRRSCMLGGAGLWGPGCAVAARGPAHHIGSFAAVHESCGVRCVAGAISGAEQPAHGALTLSLRLL